MQLTNSVCIVDYFPEAFIADEGVKRFIKRVTFPSDYGKDHKQSWSVMRLPSVSTLLRLHEVNERIASGADVTGFNTEKCPDSYTFNFTGDASD